MQRSPCPPTHRLQPRRLLTVGAMTAALALLLTACLSSTPLEDLGANLSRAVAVNERGVIVGEGLDDNQHAIPVIFDPDSGVMSPIPPLNNGSGEALDVNDHGLVVGHSFAKLLDCLIPPPVLCPISVDHAYLYDSITGRLEDLADFGVGAVPPGSQQTDVGSDATGVNEAGVVVGAAVSVGPGTGGVPFVVYRRAFAFDSVTDSVTDLSVYGMTSAADINENGQVLGQIGDHAAVVDLTTGAVTDIGTFGGTFSQGHALNDEGLVVGSAQVADNSAFHAFVYDMTTGVLTDIGTLPQQGAPNSTAYGVNNDAIVVGTSAASGGQHPFAYDVPAKSRKDLGLLGASIHVEARDINDAGTVVGFSSCPRPTPGGRRSGATTELRSARPPQPFAPFLDDLQGLAADHLRELQIARVARVRGDRAQRRSRQAFREAIRARRRERSGRTRPRCGSASPVDHADDLRAPR